MPFSFRLDPETEARIRRLAAKTGKSRSMVVREAVEKYAAEDEEASARGPTAYDRLKPYIGIASTGGKNYSQNTHEKFRAILEEKRRTWHERPQKARGRRTR
jgi:predicted DNA-binding protein